MKKHRLYILAIIILILPVRGFAQFETEIVDKGFGILAIGKKMSELKTYLVAADSSKLRDTSSAAGIGDEYVSAWTVDLKKAKMEFYFRQKITSIEVYFADEYDMETGEPTGKQVVKRFNIYIETPPTRDAEIDFQVQLTKYYGAAIEAKSGNGEIMNWLWFTDSTMLQVIFGYGYLEKNGVWVAEYYNPKG
ncbi:MAG TPA: hypothetical protein VK826_08595 [Bacteroidia bacterium]|nr:hypothetical protein [Bacteroidia bacterium]